MLRVLHVAPRFSRHVAQASLVFFPAFSSLGCAVSGGSEPEPERTFAVAQAVTAPTPVDVCNQDPRVWMNLVPLSVCAGARVFFDETFSGNGRTCGTCHPAANNYTIDPTFLSTLPAADPLFVAENPAFNLGSLETADLRGSFTLIKENVDGFQDILHKFVGRAVSHTLSLSLTLTRDPADGTSAQVVQRTGWGGDGSPGDGSLRSFIDGAITQHYPKDDSRTPGTSFRLSTSQEKDQLAAFQLALGRTNELNLNTVTLTDAGAAAGKAAFMDPLVGRCNECHSNAGANALLSGKNRNFDTGTIGAPTSFSQLADGRFVFDGGFGGAGLANPNLVTVTGQPDAFGDGTFSPPPLVEAADTGPFFHTHAFGNPTDPTKDIEAAVSFYASSLFLNSPAALELDARFGAPVNVGPVIGPIGRFLRVLNASFNLAIADQRMTASRALNVAFWAFRDDVQKGLLRLASEEIDDAIRVLENGGTDLHPAQRASLASARTLLAQAVAATDPAVRRDRTDSAKALVSSAKAAFGTNMTFQLGTGNLMF
jgi:cytochrome c peroxidase